MTNHAEDVAREHESGLASTKQRRSDQKRAADRILALLATAEDAAKRGDEATRVQALDKASALQIKYAVEETLLRKEEGRETEEVEFKIFLRGESNTPLIKAKRQLITTVAVHHRGKAVLQPEYDQVKRKWNKRAYVRVFAHASDLRFIEALYTSLLLQMQTMMERDERAYVAEQQARYPFNSSAHKTPNGWRVSYAYGFSDRINHRLILNAERNEADTSAPGTALVLRDRTKLVETFTAAYYGGDLREGKGHPRGTHNTEGARAGREAANQADLGGRKVASRNQGQIGS